MKSACKFLLPFPVERFPFDFKLEKFSTDDKDVIVPKFSAHTHPNAIEIQFIFNGAGYYFINNNRYQLAENTLFVIPGNCLHFYLAEECRYQVHKANIFFNPDFFKKYLIKTDMFYNSSKRSLHRVQFLRFNTIEARPIRKILADLDFEWQTKNEFHHEAIIADLSKLAILSARKAAAILKNQPENAVSNNGGDDASNKVIAFIEKYFKEKIGLKDIADSMGMSVFSISRCFKKHTGYNLKKYLAKKRVASAIFLLKNRPDLSMSWVALDSGFSDFSSFNRNFRYFLGITPTQYRKISLSRQSRSSQPTSSVDTRRQRTEARD